jgi:hypothetical protein
MHIGTFIFGESVLRGGETFAKYIKTLHMPPEAMAHLADGLRVCLNALLWLKVEKSLICLAGTQYQQYPRWSDSLFCH